MGKERQKERKDGNGRDEREEMRNER